MKEDRLFQNIQNALENLPENFSILEEQIEIEVQMEYFEFSRKIKKKNISEECFKKRDELFDPEIEVKRKKEILTAIAVLDNVKAYRTIERFRNEAEGDMKQWSVLALQESRMLLQSSLLDEQQVFISTGLGGKGKKLRYYVVFINRNPTEILNQTQQKLLKDELIFEIKNHEGVFEIMDFMDGFSTALVMLPIHVDIKSVFRNIVDECNQYGNFLDEDMIITNVKVLSRSEILELINRNVSKNDLNELEK